MRQMRQGHVAQPVRYPQEAADRGWHEACSTLGMRCIGLLAFCLAALGACSTTESPDGPGTGLRPQPEPDNERYPTLEPARIHLERTATGLLVRGDAGAADGTDVQVVITEVRRGAPLQEVNVAADRSFSAQLTTTGATDVQLSAVVEDRAGTSLVLHVDDAGRVSTVPAPCLTGTTGLWQFGNVSSQGSAFDVTLDFQSYCDSPVTVNAIGLRVGTEFSLGSVSLPTTLQSESGLAIPVHFALTSGEPTTGPARYDFVDIDTTPPTGGGFVLRVTRVTPH